MFSQVEFGCSRLTLLMKKSYNYCCLNENVNKYLVGTTNTLFFQQGVNPTVQTIYGI